MMQCDINQFTRNYCDIKFDDKILFRNSILIEWNFSKKKFIIYFSKNFNFNIVFIKRIDLFIEKYLIYLKINSTNVSSYKFLLCVDDGKNIEINDQICTATYSSISKNNFLICDPHFLESNGYEYLKSIKKITFTEKKDIVYWRGNLNDIDINYLNEITNDSLSIDNIDFSKLSNRLQLTCYYNQKLGFDIKLGDLIYNIDKAYFKEKIIPYLEKNSLIDQQPTINQNNFKYSLNINGNVNAWSFLEKMGFNVVNFLYRSEKFYSQWYYNRIQPGKHYLIFDDIKDLNLINFKKEFLLFNEIASSSFNFFNQIDFKKELNDNSKNLLKFLKKQ